MNLISGLTPTPTPTTTPDPKLSWAEAEEDVVKEATRILSVKLANTMNAKHPSWKLSQDEAFLAVYKNTVLFTKTGRYCSEATPASKCWAKTYFEGNTTHNIHVFRDAEIRDSVSESSYHWTVHELGHAFIDAVGKESTDPTNPIKILETAIKENKHLGRPPEGSLWGFAGSFSAWQNSTVDSAAEVFADMYTGWVYNKWEVKIDENDNPVTDGNGNPVLTTDGQNRASFMNKHMSDWIEVAIKNEN